MNGVSRKMQRRRKTGRAHYPQIELAERWPDWKVVMVPLRGYEAFLPDCRLILLDTDSEDLELELAHRLAHLDLHLETILAGEGLTVAQEVEAAWLADMRLDRVWARDWESGESA